MASPSLYMRSMQRLDKFVPKSALPLWNSPAGPKTVFFWAPLFKWGLVIAGIGDLSRPAEQLSVRQSGSLAVTGFVWARYSLVIIPKTWSLFAVNMFVGLTQLYQAGRAVAYEMSQEKKLTIETNSNLEAL
ncbi:mitochondrial pyruvate carrier 2-like isoform X2 [Ctenocephalides felis]|uniref:mitochondrial pyruvate carrier 2-like isoform X2 n=1 Tax=Ctenocephalides felis TaxID=7515 RepID=UPI000E6E16D8|nr:mitochondrial pyruvate carrier 2-like isoform X2 [Ctenocephalides felis]XP_026477395.1 mitochondrial pyruvate carrier 2-like isoform X2 [Ctenocephalides felis]